MGMPLTFGILIVLPRSRLYSDMMRSLLVLLLILRALRAAQDDKPLVSPVCSPFSLHFLSFPQLTTQETFPSQITLNPLLEGVHHLSSFANAYPEGNRVFGGAAHEDTIDYIYRELTQTSYYDVTKQPQVHLWSKTEQNLAVNHGYIIGASAMTYTPSVNVTAGVVHVLNGGC